MNLTLVSCNIRFDNPADGAHSWQNRRALLVRTLRGHSPDIISTQEGRYDQLKELEELLQDYELIDQHRSWIKERMYPCIYVKKNRFEILKSEDLWLSETPDVAGSISFNSTFPRLMTWVSVQPKNAKQKILLVNTHLDHLSRETREAQAQVLVREIQRSRDGQNIMAIMGDFNDSPESSVQKILRDGFPSIIDSWKKFHPHEETSHHAFKGLMPDGSRIDWILVEGAETIVSCEMDKTCEQELWPSDHFPIVCKISL